MAKGEKPKKQKKLIRSARRKGVADSWQDKVRMREAKARARRNQE